MPGDAVPEMLDNDPSHGAGFIVGIGDAEHAGVGQKCVAVSSGTRGYRHDRCHCRQSVKQSSFDGARCGRKQESDDGAQLGDDDRVAELPNCRSEHVLGGVPVRVQACLGVVMNAHDVGDQFGQLRIGERDLVEIGGCPGQRAGRRGLVGDPGEDASVLGEDAENGSFPHDRSKRRAAGGLP